MTTARVPRRAAKKGGAAIRRRQVEIIFQRYPGMDSSSAVAGLDYTVRVEPSGIITKGTTGSDGKVRIRLYVNEFAILNIMGSEFKVTVLGRLLQYDTVAGLQRRLSMLGYLNADVNLRLDESTEYALLAFQADNAPLCIDGLPDSKTQARLRDKIGE